jgi:hypothetical protein
MGREIDERQLPESDGKFESDGSVLHEIKQYVKTCNRAPLLSTPVYPFSM